MLFLWLSSNIHRVESYGYTHAYTHAHGHSLAPVSAPVKFVAHGFTGILYPLPSLVTTNAYCLFAYVISRPCTDVCTLITDA